MCHREQVKMFTQNGLRLSLKSMVASHGETWDQDWCWGHDSGQSYQVAKKNEIRKRHYRNI